MKSDNKKPNILSSMYVNMMFPKRSWEHIENLNIVKRDIKRRVNIDFDDLQYMPINKCYYYLRKYKREMIKNRMYPEMSEFFYEILPENEKHRITWAYVDEERLTRLKYLFDVRMVAVQKKTLVHYKTLKHYHQINLKDNVSLNSENVLEKINELNVICKKLANYYNEDEDMISIFATYADSDLLEGDKGIFPGCDLVVDVKVVDVDNWSEKCTAGNKLVGNVYSQIFLLLPHTDKIELQNHLDKYWEKLQSIADHDEVTEKERLYRGCTMTHLIYFTLLTTDNSILGRNWFENHCKRSGIFEELSKYVEIEKVAVKICNLSIHTMDGLTYSHTIKFGLRESSFKLVLEANFMDKMKQMELLHLITDEAWIDLEKNGVDVKLYKENLKLN